MQNEEKDEIKAILEDILDEKELVRENKIRKVVKEVIDNSEWYSNKELFERLEGLSQDLNQTQTYVRKYNNLMDKLIQTQELAEKNNTEIEKIFSNQEGEEKAKKESKYTLELIISGIMMFVGVISLMFTIAVNLL